MQLGRTGFSSQNRKPAAVCNLAENLDSKKTPDYSRKVAHTNWSNRITIMKINKMDQESPDYICGARPQVLQENVGNEDSNPPRSGYNICPNYYLQKTNFTFFKSGYIINHCLSTFALFYFFLLTWIQISTLFFSPNLSQSLTYCQNNIQEESITK